jgi:Glyoxalase-like domain
MDRELPQESSGWISVPRRRTIVTVVQLTVDRQDPNALAQFWMTALHYVPEPPPRGHETWHSGLAAMGVPRPEWDDGASASDPKSTGPVQYFSRVPEPKTVKNGLHLDLDVAARGDSIAARTTDVEAELVRLTAVGATVRAGQRS